MSAAWRRGLLHLGAALCWLAAPSFALAQEAGAVVSGVEAVETAEALASVAPTGFSPPVSQASYNVPEAALPDVPWYQHMQQAAQAYGVDVHLLHALVKVESGFDPMVVSRAGAVGLMQIMPATAVGFVGLRGTRQSLVQQLQDPAINVHAGAKLVRSLMDTFSHRLDLVLAAYNAGEGNVRKSGNRVPANGETPQFVKKVTSIYTKLKAAALASNTAAPTTSEPGAFIPAQSAFMPQ